MLIDLEDKIKELITNLDKETFFINFLELYSGVAKSAIKKVKNVSVYDGLENKTKFLIKAEEDNLLDNYIALENKVLQRKTKPRYIIVTDFNELYAKDTKTLERLAIKFEELPQSFSFFLAWNNIEKVDYEKENPMDVKAAERFSRVYDELVKQNPDLDSEDLNLFLIRILFCLFAEDTDIFPMNKFSNDLKTLTKEDGSDTNVIIKTIFEKLSTNIFDKDKIASYLVDYPYVNGNLFTKDHVEVNFDYKLRKLIIEAGEMLNWAEVNPDILGSMLQAVASSDKRSHLGMHYTSVPNILKTIKPLFLNELNDKISEIVDSELKNNNKAKKLIELLERISKMKFLDPACGSGNFLIIAYKELRRVEMRIYEELENLGEAQLYLEYVKLDQFYGIEIDNFASDVAMLSMWIADHQMNVELAEKLKSAARPTIPLKKIGGIYNANALRIDWQEVCPRTEDEEVFIFGNPPYLGARLLNKEQNQEMENIFKGVTQYKRLDYIGAWFYLGAKYIENTNSKLSFVSTNSICQGEQVALMWKPILELVEIGFAYTSFKWQNSAKANAGVTVIVVGLTAKNDSKEKYIYSEESNQEIVKKVENINPYLAEGETTFVENRSENINRNISRMVYGNMARDDGGLILSKIEYNKQVEIYPQLKKVCKKFIGSNEFIAGDYRYVMWFNESNIKEYRDLPFVKERLNIVRNYRINSSQSQTKEYAEFPYLFVVRGGYEKATDNFNGDPNEMFNIIVPRTSSENRLYVPMGIVDNGEYIISDGAQVIYNAPLYLLGLLQSRMHMVWLKNIGGKLETRYRYSNTLVYNTFPIPDLSEEDKLEIEDRISYILDVRDEELLSLAELYGSPLATKNPKPMNQRLLNAHKALDRYIDKLYSKKEFSSDEERLSVLLKMYQQKIDEEKKEK
ncbi:DNA methyltransferase [uncultured Gemella sp.]|uniref:class I SAM-dependent DNA methyltransferase n=1 Tax=uncultured Gemella sp. TaxID=254352 RepID=UPI0028EB3176|nr:DNA methyltransferase [uncultured Gemella sp.]